MMDASLPMAAAAQTGANERPYIIRTYDRWIIFLIVVVGGWFLFKPIFAYTVYYRGLNFERALQLTTAEHYYRKSIAIDPYLDEAWKALGELYYMRAPSDRVSYAQAVTTFKEGLVFNPHSEPLWFDLGRTYMVVGHDYAYALAALTRSYRENPKDWVAWDYAAWASLRLGDEKLAVRYWRQTLKLTPNEAVRQALREHGG